MDPATFIATALAGAVLKEVATDTYKAVKARLVETFKLGSGVEMLERDPADEDARRFLESKLAKSGAAADAEVQAMAEAIAEEIRKLPADTPLGAHLTVRDIEAEAAEFRRNRIRSGGSASFEEMKLRGRLLVEDTEVGDDRKR